MIKFKLFNGLEVALNPDEIVSVIQVPQLDPNTGQALIPMVPHEMWISIHTIHEGDRGSFTVVGDFNKTVTAIKAARRK